MFIPTLAPSFLALSVHWKCDLVGQVSEMLRLLQMGPFMVLTTFLIPMQSSWQLSLLELPPPPCQITVTPSSDSSNMYTSTVQSSTTSANAALSPHPCLQTSYPPSAYSLSSPSAPLPPSLLLAFLLCLLPPLPP